MAAYRPEQRAVAVRCLLSRGWIDGTLHLPPKALLVDYLNHALSYLTMTGVRAEGSDRAIAYLSLRRDAIAVLVPELPELLEAHPGPAEALRSHRVYCLLHQGSIRGTVELLEGVRVSDYFAHRQGFVLLRNAAAKLPDATGVITEQSFPAVLVATDHVLGVSEPQAF